MRTQYCGRVDESLIGSRVELCGWVHRRRDHGGIVFMDVRDREGICQIVTEPDKTEAFAAAEACRNEYVIRAVGVLRRRPEGMVNKELPTGALELVADELKILARAGALAFSLDDYSDPGEETRMRHRYLDIRRPEMIRRLKMRSAGLTCLRSALDAEDFLETETPQLVRSTPEGARDYLVPSRAQPGHCFALAQSPQLYKQMLMVGGLDRYYQVARCFRDEDLRADRQPEFTQLDVEMSFVERVDVMSLAERLMAKLLTALVPESPPQLPPFVRMKYADCLQRYGSDKPDLRNPLELVEVSDLFVNQEFGVLREPALAKGSRVACLRLLGGADLTRSQLDGYTDLVRKYGAGGMAWIRVHEPSPAKLQAPILKFLDADCLAQLLQRVGAQAGDMLLFGAGTDGVVNACMDALRRQLGEDRQLLKEGNALCWVEDFPLFERDKQGQLSACHHPFTRTVVAGEAPSEDAISSGYDLVMNGYEIAGGSMRIHDADEQLAVFAMLGIDRAEAEEKFGFLLRALRSGCPPHGGIAFGYDRIIMLLAQADSLRDVIAFPKTQTASCSLTGAPSWPDSEALALLGLRSTVVIS